ncbi:hypothetical protein V6N12_074449 [Hibiscus sabdariffa]|uniref:Uncharacterized protein n=1 Tax=Hibiscus sabdariffa TaxID=183260 RepID=A0ABR2BL58_9ROSI
MSNINHPNVKSGIAYSDFKILEKDLGKDLIKVGRFSVPPGLVPIARKIDERHGDIAKPSSQSDCAANPSFILLCAQSKRCALNLRFEVGFAIDQLKRIARAYFDLKAIQGKVKLPSESEANYFWGKPLSVGLFDH